IGCPVDYVAALMLGLAGAAIGTSVVVEVKRDWREPALLWVVVIGVSGDGKSPALRIVCLPLYALQEVAKSKFEGGWSAYQKALREAKSDEERKAAEAHRPESLERYFLDDTTVEAVARVLRDNLKGVVLINDEGSAWVRG